MGNVVGTVVGSVVGSVVWSVATYHVPRPVWGSDVGFNVEVIMGTVVGPVVVTDVSPVMGRGVLCRRRCTLLWQGPAACSPACYICPDVTASISVSAIHVRPLLWWRARRN